MNTHYDDAITLIADYLCHTKITNEDAFDTARACLADTLGCAILALQFPACTKLLGPIVEGTIVPNGCRVPGTKYVLDPILAAFNIGTLIRWLDYNDTWLAAEWGHPSDNLGGLIAIADYLRTSKHPLKVKDLLTCAIQAHEIQGQLALQNSFNRVGLDHVILVKIATCAVVTKMMGGSFEEICKAVSNAWIDLGPMRTYRHSPNTGSRKSWAAGDATSRGVQLSLRTLQGEMGYPTALTAPKWGLYDVIFKGKPFSFEMPFGSYVMENVLFKISFPAEFHAQTAIECALQLYPKVKDKWDEIDNIEIETHESAIRIIDKKGPLKNPADRDHCLQYMVAIALLYGNVTADHYEDEVAANPSIDELRSKMRVKEDLQFSKDYLDPSKRSIANSIKVVFKDGTVVGPVKVEYPIGHRLRRTEGLPILYDKFLSNLKTHYSPSKSEELVELFQNKSKLENMPVSTLLEMF